MNLINCEIAGVHFVYSNHHIIKLRKAFSSAIIFIDNARAGGRDTALPFIFTLKLQAFVLTGVVVEPQPAPLDIRHIGKTIVLSNFYQSVLQILWMCEFPMVNNSGFL